MEAPCARLSPGEAAVHAGEQKSRHTALTPLGLACMFWSAAALERRAAKDIAQDQVMR